MNSWERINSDDDNEDTQRLKVIGGWIVLTTVEYKQGYGGKHSLYHETQCAICQVFVPDATHEWKI